MLRSKKGYVYILVNDLYKDDLLKIGMTTRSPEIRASELYEKHSGVPGRFKVIHKKQVEDCEFAEALIHKNLDQYRVNNYREFFKIPTIQAKAIIDEVCNDISKIHLKRYNKITLPSPSEANSKSRQSPQRYIIKKNPLPPTTTSYKTEKSYFCKVCNKRFGVGSKDFDYSKRICAECAGTATNKDLSVDFKKDEQKKIGGETQKNNPINFKSKIESLVTGDISIDEFRETCENNFQNFSSFMLAFGYSLQKDNTPNKWALCSAKGVTKHIYDFQNLVHEILIILYKDKELKEENKKPKVKKIKTKYSNYILCSSCKFEQWVGYDKCQKCGIDFEKGSGIENIETSPLKSDTISPIFDEMIATPSRATMSKGQRIILSILAWIACHFVFHIAFAAAENDRPPNGLITIINICVAWATYYFTGSKGAPGSLRNE